MLKAAMAGKTVAFGGFLLGCIGAFFPFLGDYRGFNGIECALLFLNRNESVPDFFILAVFFLASGAGLAFSLKPARWPFFAVPAAVGAALGIAILFRFGFRMFPLGWAAIAGSVLQAIGSAAYAIGTAGRGSAK